MSTAPPSCSAPQQTTHGAVQFAVYEEFKHTAARWGQSAQEQDRQLGSLELSLYGGLSKFVAAVSSYPAQVVRSRLQQRFEGRSLVYS
jgi:solute carrier family 25 folate transporter 32